MNYNYNYDYSYGYDAVETTSSIFGGMFAALGIYMLLMAAVGIFMIISTWKLFKKAGKKGWESIIPIYNTIVLIEIAGLPLWYIALFFVPFANIYAMFKIYIEIAHKFGQSTGFGIASVFFPYICIPILAFGSSTYQGNISNEPINNAYNPNQPVNPQPTYDTYQQPVMPTETPVQPEQPQNTFMFNEPTVNPVVEPEPTNIFNSQPVINQLPSEPVAPVQPEPVSQVEPVAPVMPNVTDIPQPMVEQVKYCPNCGNKTNITADTCFMCGHKFQ